MQLVFTGLISKSLNMDQVYAYYGVFSFEVYIYDQLTLRKYFMHAKMNSNLQALHYIKHRPWDALFMQISGNRKRDY